MNWYGEFQYSAHSGYTSGGKTGKVIGADISAKHYTMEGSQLFSAANFLHCIWSQAVEDGRTCFFFPISDFSSLFLQAFQQSSAASLLGPRSGNPGYIVGKPLLSLTDDISHAVSFLAYCSLMRKLQLLIFWIFRCKVPHFLGIQNFLYQTINTYVLKCGCDQML